MKKYSNLLSLLLVPAMVMQATSTCSSGGGTAPALTLPGSVKGIQTFSFTSATPFNFSVTAGTTSGFLATGATYGVWCTNSFGVEPGGGTNPNNTVTPPSAEDPSNSTGVATYTPVDSRTIAGAGNASYGEPGLVYGSTTGQSLTLAQEWAAVNWILNNPGFTGTVAASSDEQAAIWQLLEPENVYGYVTAPGTTANALALYEAAVANGTNFAPTTGQFVAVFMLPTMPTDGIVYQGFLIPYQIACTSTGSATLTKTVNVGAAGANAFQLVTYTYTIKNTGSTILDNLVIVDDNGTPNYTGDDVTISIPATVTLAAGASYSVTSSVYLPISLFYQSGTEASFDTLIPQVIPSTTGGLASLQLTYLIDSDVTDNTYGTGASAAWAANGGHTLGQLEEGTAQFALYNAKGTLVSTISADYLNASGSPTITSASATDSATPTSSATYISLDSTLADNLNNYSVAGDATNSPKAGTANWQTTAGYKVTVNSGLFGMTGLTNFGSAAVLKNYLAATETGFSGRCGSARSATYTPSVYGAIVNSTAYLCAQVCGCSTVVHAKACLSVKLCGSTQPGCNNSANHTCQNPAHCSCTCAQCLAGNHGNCTNTTWWGAPSKCTPPVCTCTCPQCKAGNHASCSHVGCDDPICHANNCNHNTITCKLPGQSKPSVLCW